MNPELLVGAHMLQRTKKRPEELFPFYRPDPDVIDQALVLDFHPADEAAGGDPKEWAVLRTTVVGSCTDKTLRRWNEANDAFAVFQHMQALEMKKMADAAQQGDPYTPQTVPKPPEANSSALRILTARVFAEGLRSWSPAPKAIVAVPLLGIKAGDDMPLPREHLPDDPSKYEAKPNEEVIAILDALPSRYVQKVTLCIGWASNLDMMRFFPTEEEVAEDQGLPKDERLDLVSPPKEGSDAGKPSGSPSPGPSSGPETASASEDAG